MKKAIQLLGATLVAGLLLAGCGSESVNSGGAEPGKKDQPVIVQENKDPVTVLYYENQVFDDDEFEMLVTEPTKKKYPYISFDRRKGDLNKLIAAGEVPDIIQAHNGILSTYTSVGAAMDLTPMLKQYNLDTGIYESAIMESLKDDKGALLALPYAVNFTALYYNKDIFDKFGVPYPKDGMTWDQTIELAKKVTRDDGGVHYRGLDPEQMNRLTRPLALDYFNMKTMKSTMNDPRWRTIFETVKKVYTLPGNTPAKLSGNTGLDPFTKDKNVAMFATTNQIHRMVDATPTGLNWDMVQYPSLPEAPGVSTDVDAHILLIPQTAKHKEAAMKVIQVRMSDEVQKLLVSKTARVSPMKDPIYKKLFASDMPETKGKNIEGAFKGKIVAAPIRTLYLKESQAIANDIFVKYVNGEIDLNTALRQADEEINKYVASQTK
jgi:multiple sugar transport system substrate-binding protein